MADNPHGGAAAHGRLHRRGRDYRGCVEGHRWRRLSKYETASGATLYRCPLPHTGQAPDRQKRGFTTKRDAELFAATLEVAKARGELRRADAGPG